MVRITSSKESFLVEFLDSDFYLRDGSMSFPKNSLSLVCDESDIITFKRVSNNDVIFSALLQDGLEIDGTAATKENVAELFDEATTSPVGSDPEITVTGVVVAQDGSQLDFVNESGDTVYSVNMSQYLTDIHITGATLEGDILTLYQSNGDSIEVELEDMLADYYTQAETDAAIDDAVAEETQARITAVQALENHVDENAEVTARALNELQSSKASKEELQTAIESIDLSGKQDTLTPGDNITIENDVISANQVVELTQAEYDELVEQGTVDESKIYIITDAPEINLNNYTLTSTTAALQTQVNANTAAIATKQDKLTSGEGITIENNVISASFDGSNFYTKEEIDNAEQATSAALNDLNIRKLDASAYTPVDLSTYATKQELQTAIESIDLSEVENEIAAVSTQVDNNAEVTARALNELQESKADASALNGYATTATTDNLQTQLTALQTTVTGKAQIVHLTQAEYDALATKDANTIYIISDAQEVDMSLYATKQYVDDLINGINSRLTAINA